VDGNSLACRLCKTTDSYSDNGKPNKPTVYKHFVILANGDRKPLVEAPFDQATIHVKGIEPVLNVKHPVSHC
jgi:hypothetical protein